MAYSQTKRIRDLITSPPFIPTEEQRAIIETSKSGRDMVVQAYAGTGKTTTAAETAAALKRHGYFVLFSRSARRDAENRMPKGMKATTGHALAHDHIIKTSDGYARKLENNRHGNGLPQSLLAKHLDLKKRSDIGATAKQQAVAIAATIKAFETSGETEITPALIPDSAIPVNIRLTAERNQVEAFKQSICAHCETLWAAMLDEHNDFPITHDTYLKIFHLRAPYIRSELWLLDEFQDTNPVFDAIIRQQEGQKIFIGDPYQAIFGWRGAIDALQRPVEEGVDKFHLTESWRFNHQVAGAANILLSRLGETVPVKGQEYNMRQIDLHRHHAVLVRNNIKMLSIVGKYLDRRQSVYIPGGLSKDAIIKAQSAWALANDRFEDIRVSTLREMGSWSQFKGLAESYGDAVPEYRDLVSLIERHGRQLPEILEHAQRPWEDISNDPGRITLTTAHKAKGKEYAFVSLQDDLALTPDLVDKLKNYVPLSLNEREQVHLLYVAMTRAKKGLDLAPRIKQNLLDLKDTADVASLDQVTESKRHLTPEEIRKRTEAFIAKHGKKKA